MRAAIIFVISVFILVAGWRVWLDQRHFTLWLGDMIFLVGITFLLGALGGVVIEDRFRKR